MGGTLSIVQANETLNPRADIRSCKITRGKGINVRAHAEVALSASPAVGWRIIGVSARVRVHVFGSLRFQTTIDETLGCAGSSTRSRFPPFDHDCSMNPCAFPSEPPEG